MYKTEFLSTIVLLVVIVGILVLKHKNEKALYWKGELVKKRDISDEDDENHVYRLIFKTDTGKTKKVSVKEELYRKVKEGDRFEKLKGEIVPQKLS